MIKGQKHKPNRAVFIDVDGTLVVNGRLNRLVVDWTQHMRALGYVAYLWSSAGAAHALDVATEHSVDCLFDCIIDKPGIVVDDMGWSWTKYTAVVNDRMMREDLQRTYD